MAKNADEVKAEVIRDRGGVWDAFDQGRWAYHVGVPLSANPHTIPGYDGYYHVNITDWNKGWLREQRETLGA